MINIDFNDYFIMTTVMICIDILIISDQKLDPTLIDIVTFSFIGLTKFGTICLKVL